MNEVVFGLIGAGGIANSQHLPNLSRASGIRLKSVCDLNPERLRHAQEKYRVPHATTDYKELLRDKEIAAVLIATREDFHSSLTIESLRAGKHVYVEKPLADTPESCARVVEAQRNAGRMVAVGHNRRLAPAYQLAKRIFLAHGGARNIHYRIADAYYIWGRAYGPGQRIIHETCHIFDILRFLTDSDVTSVYCVQSRPDDEVITLTFASGCVAAITSSGYATYDLPKEHLQAVVDIGAVTVSDFVELRTYGLKDFSPVYRFAGHTHPDHDATHRHLFEMEGEQAMLNIRRMFWEKWDRLQQLRAENADKTERRELEDLVERHLPGCNYMVDKGWLAALEHFAQCIATGERSMLADAEDALKASLITQAAIKSRSSGGAVRL